ncbi:MAG TPA: alkaline phosphatase family protein, partial [Candidatus Tumulicola sp.]
MQRSFHRLSAAMFLLVALAACSAASVPSAEPLDAPNVVLRPVLLGRHKIKHIVVVIQENRSFVNIFAGFPGADAPTFGFLHDGTKINLTPVTFKAAGDPPHGYWSAVSDWNNGAMNNFDLLAQASGFSPTLPYRYLRRHLVQPYWDMAQRYTLADRMFETEWGGSFTAHLDLIAGTSYLQPTVALADFPSAMPWGCDAPAGTTTVTISYPAYAMGVGPSPCFNQFTTMADTLDAAGVSWKYYAPEVTEIGGLW